MTLSRMFACYVTLKQLKAKIIILNISVFINMYMGKLYCLLLFYRCNLFVFINKCGKKLLSQKLTTNYRVFYTCSSHILSKFYQLKIIKKK